MRQFKVRLAKKEEHEGAMEIPGDNKVIYYR